MATGSVPRQLNIGFGNPFKDLLSGLVVAFAMIPEAIAFSGIAGVDPRWDCLAPFCCRSPSPLLAVDRQ